MRMCWIRSVVFMIALFASTSALACKTKEQALNTMLKMNVVSAEYQLKGANESPDAEEWANRRIQFVVAMVPYAELIANGQYAEACAGYADVATEFETDLSKIKSMTVADYDRYDKKFPAKNPCSTTSLATRIVDLSSRYGGQDEDAPIKKKMNYGYAKYSHLVATDMAAVCGFMNELEVSLSGLPNVPDRSGGSVRRRNP